ncbi:Tn3 family transposase [Herbaspirillum sp. ST 5-3]|uniref:Tn3 family transposase n=1 Tax=Oxalobacteraceae TaxID=75682 RepID=UPI0010A3F351|nr:Tn3 family transposase [Herbaspirillum sp. ST 5-3]
MTSLHETAYPRFKPELTPRELNEVYRPSNEEMRFARKLGKSAPARLYLLILLKTTQRLGYFAMLADVPPPIVSFLVKFSGTRSVAQRDLLAEERSQSRRRFVEAIRDFLKIAPVTKETDRLILATALEAAQTKQDLADIINVVIEELIRQRYELPAFSKLRRAAQKARNLANDRYFRSLTTPLDASVTERFDAMLVLQPGHVLSGWQQLKQEPKKPTNTEVRRYLDHVEWLRSWVVNLPPVDQLPVVKYTQFVNEARALDAADLKATQPGKRYALMVVLFHAQLSKALDDAVEMFIRKLRKIHNGAEEQLQRYYLEHQKRTEKLVSQLRDVLEAFQEGTDDKERGKRVAAAIHDAPEQLIAECDEHMAYAGNNYLPFMLAPYQTQRPMLLNCLTLLDLESTSADLSLIDAIRFVLQHRQSHREWLSIAGENISLKWIPDKWRKLVTGQRTGNVAEVNRKYFEMCVLTETMRELQSGDLFVANSDQYSDYRVQLVDWDAYHAQVDDYGEMLEIPVEPKTFVARLKKSLAETARQVDEGLPGNENVELNGNQIILRKQDKEAKPAALDDVDRLLLERIPEKNILDILVESESWLDLHKHFGPLSGFEAKIDDPRKRFVTTLFCYGCNLGPTQTARSVKGLSRKQVVWLNLHHMTEERLDKAIVQVINAYNKFLLPKYWGSGKSASADGTKWNLYEQNLLSEYHIRYGGYGGIGYYHVSDMYIALFSHFIPCGVYEAIYILDGLIKNESEIQPDTLHGDTHAQSAPVFGLAYLLGINLMPRIRNLKQLVFFKPERGMRYQHINALFVENKTIDWELIETHLPDMLRIALSIKAGKITPSTILRRLGTASRKNKLYFAFRELGRVVRTEFLLRYIADGELRKTIQAATNKSEEFNQFIKWLFFGNQGVIAENVRHEQRKVVKYNQLVANLAILHNVESMTRLLKEMQEEGLPINEEILAGLAPYRTEHINRFGDYTLDLDRKVPPMNYSIKIL